MDTIKEMEDYASTNNIPIMEKEGLIFLCDFIKRHQIKTILEIGSAIGYSAIQMCLIDPQISVTTIERDEERYLMALVNIEAMNLTNRINIILGDALDYEISGQFDLVFIDAAKAQYTKFFEKFKQNLLPYGYIISDNLGFHGMVSDHSKIQSRNMRQLVRKIESYNDFLVSNSDFQTRFYEVGDVVGVSQLCKQKFEAVIFDMDGLLIDSEIISKNATLEVAKMYNIELNDEYFKNVIGTTSANIKTVFGSFVNYMIDYETFHNQIREVHTNYVKEHGVPLKKGALELLQYLKANNYKIVLGTSSHQNIAKSNLEHCGVLQYFDGIMCGDMITHSKPDPEIFLKASELTSVDIKKCLVLEDSINGVYAGLSAGIRVIMVPDLLEPNEIIKKEAFYIKDSLFDVLSYLKGEN